MPLTTSRVLKFLHTLSAAGLTGGLAAYMLFLWAAPERPGPDEQAIRDEWAASWTLLGLAIANCLLATWRPRFGLRGGG